jgi:hypothetical protein
MTDNNIPEKELKNKARTNWFKSFSTIDFKLLIFLILYFFSSQVFAQQKRKLILIDTLIYSDLSNDKLNIQVKDMSIFRMRYSDSSQKITNAKTPNFSCNIYIPTDTSIVLLPIDKKGSFIHIKNSYNLHSDTIHISKLIIDTLPINDSTFESIYIQKLKKSLFFFKNKPKIKRKKTSNTYNLNIKQNFIKINDKDYPLNFKINKPSLTIEIGNGRNTKTIIHKSDTTYKEIERYKRYTHIFKYHWFAEITLE